MLFRYHKRPFDGSARTAALLLWLTLATLLGKAQPPSAANQVKAAFLFNFTHFISWPSSTFPGASSPFVIGVLGNNPFESFLEKVVEGEKVNGRPIVVQQFGDVSEIKSCHILFVNKESPPALLHQLTERGILTVSDKGDFVKEGGVIGFYLENNKIRLQVNAKTARAANLTISSKLLRLANVIEN